QSALRSKLLTNTWDKDDGTESNPLARYNALLKEYDRAEAIYRTVNKAYAKGELPQTALHPEARVEAALEKGLINEEDAAFMRTFEAEVLEMLTVDDFAYDAFANDKSTLIDHNAASAKASPQAETSVK
ncbi:MAG: acyl-CoA dehydrogenase domain-containing protein, partial [Pseudomonadota bacterium]|nr:acyl-CoA dehydrogenase domain-containing protein [Pseudomonadota bacterium]